MLILAPMRMAIREERLLLTTSTISPPMYSSALSAFSGSAAIFSNSSTLTRACVWTAIAILLTRYDFRIILPLFEAILPRRIIGVACSFSAADVVENNTTLRSFVRQGASCRHAPHRLARWRGFTSLLAQAELRELTAPLLS